jgi:hypothetical protein
VERSTVGRLLISAAIVLLLLAEVATHLPDGSAAQRTLADRAHTGIRLVASEQQWDVFSPDPRSVSLQLEGRVTFADGSTEVWHLPEGPRLGANLRFYRWRKWLERVRSDDLRVLWEPTARWIADEYDDRPAPVSRVQLVRRFHANSIEGPQPPYEEYVFYTYVASAEGSGP